MIPGAWRSSGHSGGALRCQCVCMCRFRVDQIPDFDVGRSLPNRTTRTTTHRVGAIGGRGGARRNGAIRNAEIRGGKKARPGRPDGSAVTLAMAASVWSEEGRFDVAPAAAERNVARRCWFLLPNGFRFLSYSAGVAAVADRSPELGRR